MQRRNWGSKSTRGDGDAVDLPHRCVEVKKWRRRILDWILEDSAKTCKIYQIRNTFSVGKIYRESRLSLSELGGNWGNIIMNGIVVKP